jgi:DNA-directed RNA polymerase alpha subunit
MLKSKNFGRKSLKEIKEVLAEMGLSLKGNEVDYSRDITKDNPLHQRVESYGESSTLPTPEEERTWREKLYSSIEEEVLGKIAANESLDYRIKGMREQPSYSTLPPESASRLITRLKLSVRSDNSLRNYGIKTVGELCEKTEADLLRYKNFGRKSLKEIKELLAEMGLSLKNSRED